MKITDELLAAYAENHVSHEEREEVRQYLRENPSKLQSVLMLMDEDYELEPKRSKNVVSIDFNCCDSRNIAAKYEVNKELIRTQQDAIALGMDNALKAKKKMENALNKSQMKSKTFDQRLDDLLNELR